ncbi:MAG: S8 family serine peptidase [bacterium]
MMKIRSATLWLMMTGLVSLLAAIPVTLFAQSSCAAPKSHGSGYSSAISSVEMNDDGTYTIVLRVRHNGCSDEDCKAINQYYVEAEPGTYSDISWTLIYGDVSYNGIVLGPEQGGWDKLGFKVASINGMGNGNAGIFSVTYTLTELQDQTVMVKAGTYDLEIDFSRAEFEYVLDCKVGGLYQMPADAKLTESDNKIGNELTYLAEFNGTPYSNEVFTVIYDENTLVYYVLAEFYPMDGAYVDLLNELETNYGLRNTITDPQEEMITGEIPIASLKAVNELESLYSANPAYPVKTNIGLATSQGDTSMYAYIARKIFTVETVEGDRYPITGEGVKIGVISNSFNTMTNPSNQANDDVLKFDLPGIGYQPDGTPVPNPYNETNVQVIQEYPYGEASDEGRAMMQIIHDVAPGANLAFRTGMLGAVDMCEAISELVDAGCDIIVDDVTYISQPFFEDGIVAQKVDDVVSNSDISYFTSAGNFGERSCTAVFNPASESIPGIDGIPHVFGFVDGAEDIYQAARAEIPETAEPPQYFTLVLQWEDDDPTSTFSATKTDLDIYLTQETGGIIGYNTMNYGNKALEVLPFVVTETTDLNIVVVKATDNDVNVRFKYVVFRGLFNINEFTAGESTITGHANSSGAMTVGAVRYDYTPAYDGNISIMSFSSRGGLDIAGVDRYKPDFTAPNGVNTTVDLGNGDFVGDNDLFPNFFGTSASAPHAAAVAALLLEAKSAYYDEFMSPEDIRSALSSTAIGSGSYDPAYGNGFIQADMALFSFANPAPVLDYLTTESGGVPGAEVVTITLQGRYFTENTILYFDGMEITGAMVDPANGTITAEIPPFTELYPPITAYNPPVTPSLKDGGMSNALYFTQKPTIAGNMNDVTKYFGEVMPDVNLTYTLSYFDGTTIPLEDAGLSQDELDRIFAVELYNNASDLEDVGTWPYTLSTEEVLNPFYTGPAPSEGTIEYDLLRNYNFVFELGNLEILKLELTITPDDMILYYGQPISGFSYDFSYDNNLIEPENDAIIQESLLLTYEADIISDLAVILESEEFMVDAEGGYVHNSYFLSESAYDAIDNGEALALVNGEALALVNGEALALVNGEALALVNGEALALVNGEALALVNLETLVNGEALALVNIETATNGEALALVNGEALALVNNPDEAWLDESYVNGEALALVNKEALTNGEALALVNGEALALVNGEALALVNSNNFNDANNNDAVLILTGDDIRTLTDPASTNTIEFISVNAISGNTVTSEGETHKIAPGAFMANNFSIQYDLGDLTILKGDLQVYGDDQVIDEGMAAPEFTFTYSGFAYEDDELSVFGAEGPDYSIIDPDDYSVYDSATSGPGEYVVTIPGTENYNIIFPDPINLFVNPAGPGTKAVVPKLDCVEANEDGIFTAYFFYENKNDDPVYVLIGPDNIVTGGNDPDISMQPFKFEPGGGTWEAYFDGTPMVWTVSSKDSDHKTSHAQEASSDSKNCNKSSEAFEKDKEEHVMLAYPNPVAGRLNLVFGKDMAVREVSVTQLHGKVSKINWQQVAGNRLSIDMTGLPAGIYFVSINTDTNIETIKIIKR